MQSLVALAFPLATYSLLYLVIVDYWSVDLINELPSVDLINELPSRVFTYQKKSPKNY